jgi:hypothetical protein
MGSSPTGWFTVTVGVTCSSVLGCNVSRPTDWGDGPTPWPPRLPDIALLDFLVVCVKDKVYWTPVADIDTTEARMWNALAVVTEEM